MSDVHCSTPGCPATIADPCVKTNNLFLQKIALQASLQEGSGDRSYTLTAIDDINNTLTNDLGLADHEERFQFFSLLHSRSTAPITQTLVFTLECYNKHRNQYTITCNS